MKTTFLLFAILMTGNSVAQSTASIKLESEQLKTAIVALRSYDCGMLNRMVNESEYKRCEEFGTLADALQLSFDLNASHVITASGASLIHVALEQKKRREEYAASPEGKRDAYNREHPTYTLRNGSAFIPLADSVYFARYRGSYLWSSNGDGRSYIGIQTGERKHSRTIWFVESAPGIYKETK